MQVAAIAAVNRAEKHMLRNRAAAEERNEKIGIIPGILAVCGRRRPSPPEFSGQSCSVRFSVV